MINMNLRARVPLPRYLFLALWLFGTAFCVARGEAQRLDTDVWGTDGNVVATMRYGGKLYIAGAFNSVGPISGGGIAVDPVTGEPLSSFPRVNGTVRVILNDGTGGFFMGGSFTAVGSVPCLNLAHVTSLGHIAGWYPNPDGEVDALALHEGRLFVGGRFHSIAGELRAHIAAVEVSTGRATNFDPSADSTVRVLQFAPSGLYIGGDFARLGGQTRHGIARMDSSLTSVSSWDPDANFSAVPGAVHAIACLNDTIYLGGFFGNLGSSVRHNLAAVSASSGALLDWAPEVTGPNDRYWGDPYVDALAVQGTSLLVAGHFAGVSGQPRDGIAAVDRATGVVTPWNPAAGTAAQVTTLLLNGNSVRVGGFFGSFGGQRRRGCAEVDLTTGTATAWNPNPNDAVLALASDRRFVYVGGYFTGAGSRWQPRHCLAALDATTGELEPWRPDPDGLFVDALAAHGGRVYAGGHFLSIGGQVRTGLAALDTLSGAATNWKADTNGAPLSLAIAGDTLLVGGEFTSLGGVARRFLGAVDLNSALVTNWDPAPNDWVKEIVVANGVSYAAGSFSSIGASPRNGVAAIDLVTGQSTPWNPNADGWVNSIAVGTHDIFVCGAFHNIGGKPRNGLAALDPISGAASSWTADVNSYLVYSLAMIGDTLFVGGNYTEIGGQPRKSLAALDATSGSVFPWNPDLGDVNRGPGGYDAVVWSLATVGEKLYAGGLLGRAGLEPIASIAAFDFAPQSPDSGQDAKFVMAAIWPNPIRAGQTATIRVALAHPDQVRIDLFDTGGRRVTAVQERTTMPAGPHDLLLKTDGLRSGFYFCRIETGSASAARKLVVLR